jgi:hypothetical protein
VGEGVYGPDLFKHRNKDGWDADVSNELGGDCEPITVSFESCDDVYPAFLLLGMHRIK